MHISKWVFNENMWKNPLAFCLEYDKIFAVMYFYANSGGANYEYEEVNQYVINCSLCIFYGGMRQQ